jgi:hypothetical protein
MVILYKPKIAPGSGGCLAEELENFGKGRIKLSAFYKLFQF